MHSVWKFYLDFCICIIFFYVSLSHQGFPLGLNDGHIYTWTDGLRRRDWHDYESIRKDGQRVGTAIIFTQTDQGFSF